MVSVNKEAIMYKQLTKEDRLRIYEGLNRNESLSEIGRAIGKDRSTIAREIKRNREAKAGPYSGRRICARKKEECPVHGACGGICIKASCWRCAKICGPECPQFAAYECRRLKAAPYVCNGCRKRARCDSENRYAYNPNGADEMSSVRRSESRSGYSMDMEEVLRLNGILSEGVSRGQSIHNIILSHGGEEAFGYSERTIYRYVDAGIFPDVRNIDLVRKVRYRPRRKSCSQMVKVDKKCRIGRTYEDFQAYMAQHPDTAVVQVDTVEGKKGGPVLLTLHFTVSNLMLAFARARNDSASVAEAFDWIEQAVGPSLFRRLFPVILTDNGSEFSNPRAIEADPSGGGSMRTSVFYCHAGASFEKGACEVNHEFIRRVIPKGADIPLSQPKTSLMMSHINSYAREGLNGRSPYDLFSLIYGEETLQKLGIQRIPAREIILKPELLR